MRLNPPDLSHALREATWLESRREYATAAALLDAALYSQGISPAPLRFRALVLRAELAVSLNAGGEARGILAEARQLHLDGAERESLETEMRRADDLEVFLTHRGCAG